MPSPLSALDRPVVIDTLSVDAGHDIENDVVVATLMKAGDSHYVTMLTEAVLRRPVVSVRVQVTPTGVIETKTIHVEDMAVLSVATVIIVEATPVKANVIDVIILVAVGIVTDQKP